jgi:hypothetical protein
MTDWIDGAIMPRNVGKLEDEEIARQFVDLVSDKQVAKTLRALALQHELERRHGQQHARSFIVAEQTKRNRLNR